MPADPSGQNRPADSAEISLVDVIGVFWQRRWLMLSVIVLVTILAAVAAFVMTPVYRATIVLSPAQNDKYAGRIDGLAGQLGGLAALAGLPANESAQTEEAIATLRSRAFTEKFIREQDLLPELFASVWDADSETWQVESAEDTPSLADGFGMMNEQVRSIVRDATTGLLSMHVDWTDPQRAADWANEMVAMVNLYLRERAIDEARKSIEYLNKELAKTSVVESRSAIFGLMESQIQSIMLANVREEYGFKVIDPAIPPEADNFYRPNRPLLIAVGFSAGIVLAGFLALSLAIVARLR